MTPLEILGLPEGATKQEVRDAARPLMSMAHPDKGGTTDEFNRVRKAFEQALEEAPDDRDPEPCPVCKGTRTVKLVSGFSIMDIVCSECMGSGVRER